MDNPLIQVCFYINKKIILASWMVEFHSPNLCILRIKTTTNRILHIHNIYNPTNVSKKPSKIFLPQMILENRPIDKHMVLRDFKLHYSNWKDPNCYSDLLASDLVILAEQYHLAQLLPLETITYSKGFGKLTIDLFFATSLIAENFLTCKIVDDFNHNSDHMPILITISLATYKAQVMSSRTGRKLTKKNQTHYIK